MGLLGATVPVLYAAAAASSARADWPTQRRELLMTAGCDVFISTTTSSESVDLAADAAVDATAIICGDRSSGSDEIEAVAEASARAAARAVASVAASCYANGNGSFRINGLTIAQSEARAYARAYAEGTASAAACNKCSAAAEFIAESWSEIFFDAVVEAETNLQGAANGGSVTAASNTFVEAVAEATVVAYAAVLATASASVDDGCNVELLSLLATGDASDPNEVFCDINVSGIGNTIAQNVVVSAVFEAEAEACEDKASSGGRSAARALARAMAEAISTVVADCAVIGDGFACALGEADIRAMASATADAFARGFVSAVSTCDRPKCTITIEAIVENTESVLAKAASEAYGAACAGSGDSFSINEIQRDIVDATIDALAEAIVEAVVDGDDCSISINVDADVIPSSTCDGKCARNFKKCGGRNFPEVLHCCNDSFKCVKKNNNYMQCREGGRPPANKPGWDGSIVTCGKQ